MYYLVRRIQVSNRFFIRGRTPTTQRAPIIAGKFNQSTRSRGTSSSARWMTRNAYSLTSVTIFLYLKGSFYGEKNLLWSLPLKQF